MKKAIVIDYGAGNLKNVTTALNEIGIYAEISRDKEKIEEADILILPGVGAFPDAMESLTSYGLDKLIKEEVKKGKPLLGICLGMQMLFDESEEIKNTKGLGLIPGKVVPFKKEELTKGSKIPHMGWNSLNIEKEDPFLKGVNKGDYVYYVHSYYAKPDDFDENVLAWSDYTVKVPGIVKNKNVIGTQFHPEKSSKVGRQMLINLKEMLES